MSNGNSEWVGEERRAIKQSEKSEWLNSTTRAMVVLMLIGGYTLIFTSVLWTGKIVVDVGAYSVVLGVAMTWLFKSRDAEQQAKETKEAVKASKEATVVAVPSSSVVVTPPNSTKGDIQNGSS